MQDMSNHPMNQVCNEAFGWRIGFYGDGSPTSLIDIDFKIIAIWNRAIELSAETARFYERQDQAAEAIEGLKYQPLKQ